jgi:hypothetical protein
MANGFSAGDLTLSIGTTASETLKVLDAIIGRLDLIEKGLGGIKGNSSHIRKSSSTPKSSGFGLAKFGVSIYMLRRMGRFMGNLVQAGSDYYETLNLWQVAMRGNLDTADQFINKMNKAYGISTKTLMNAQAIFKNMIGSLGQISDATAYALSEALVQMSADFSSLYNVQLEKAFEKMQAMLAGQVRPIRSAGLDMTETTLFMFYQQLGGTKTMRQLNRTEKQLLSILAVYNQMGSAGALGDMTKTLNSFANQSRMMVEYWRELKAWSGLLIKDLLEEWQVLKYINAALITMTEIVKAIAKSRGLGEENFIDGMFESVEATNDAVDELQGKLLDFDKFRSLEGAGASPLAIDEKLLQAITGYSSKIEDAVNEAQLLAETWLEVLGFTKGANGEFEITTENLEKIKTRLKVIGAIIGTILGLGIFAWLVKLGSTIFTYGIVPLVTFGKALWTYVIVPLAKDFASGIKYYLTSFTKWLNSMELGKTATIGFNAGLALLLTNITFLALGWNKMNSAEKVVGIFGAIGSAALMAAAAVAAFHGAWTMGTAAVAIVGGLAAIVGAFTTFRASMKDLEFFANGASDIDSGTLFVAGEMGKTEAVFSGSNGKTNVANIQQMKTAYKEALNEWWRTARNDVPAFEGVSESGLYTMVDGEARRRGKKFVNV